jgi:FixJ family two-component response regulator
MTSEVVESPYIARPRRCLLFVPTKQSRALETAIVVGENDTMIFIVDDDEAVRDSLKVLLVTHGLPVEDYESIETFKREYQARPRSCLLLDQHLAASTGLEFLASVEGRGLAMPVIMITGQGDKNLRAQARDMDVAAFLEKPIASDLLLSTIHDALQQ